MDHFTRFIESVNLKPLDERAFTAIDGILDYLKKRSEASDRATVDLCRRLGIEPPACIKEGQQKMSLSS